MLSRFALIPLALSVALAGCSPETGSVDDAGAAPIASTTSATTTDATPTEDEPWDLLVFTHSLGSGLADVYAPIVADQLDAQVEAHDFAIGGLEPAAAVLHMQGAAHPPAGEAVRGAEIILVTAILDDVGDWWDACGLLGPTSSAEQPPPLSAQELAAGRSDFEAELKEIAVLRDGQPTALIAMEYPIGKAALWEERGFYDVCMEGWEAFFAMNAEVVEAHGGVMVPMLDVFHGPNHDGDPWGDGLVGVDGTHLSDEGIALLAETLASTPIELRQLTAP